MHIPIVPKSQQQPKQVSDDILFLS